MFTQLIGLRLVLGICFISYGLLLSALEKYDGLPFFNFKRNSYINGFIYILVGVLVCSTNFINFIISTTASIVLIIIECYFINKLIQNKNKHEDTDKFNP